MHTMRIWILSLLTALLMAGLPTAQAQGFAAYVSPPRFELEVQPGTTQRQVLEIQHVGQQTARYRVYTADWLLQDDGSVLFSDTLAAHSCRPWVALERRELTLAPRAKIRFRFEISPPADAPLRECRFALMVEGVDPNIVKQGALNIPVGGRIGVIVYASMAGSRADLVVTGSRVIQLNGRQLPALEVHNKGSAHTRLAGILQATDASGQSLELVPADLPVLPDSRRVIALMPVVSQGGSPPQLQFPLQVKGTLEIGPQRLPLEQRFAP